ncbi:MlaD family protein [Patulibacter sp. SYSU D01012]|uniref:MlaD family protein n=1 Tax=Patulibacter sp. SYSU D01012 TaxID=2817381 RepID=UPI001B31207F|nr:MlaD family protein [Patulibacter sp. SYSU D01012]
MNPRARRSSIAANPVLIGAATVLIAIVGVVLAYNANNGLPFVKTYQLKAQVPDAAGLIVGNDVRAGGTRIGFVSGIAARTGRDGDVGATITLKLDETVRPLPEDTQIEIRPRSVLGLKYVQLTKGRSKRMLADGGTIPLRYAAAKPVELDDLFNTFDEDTRSAAAQNTVEFGNMLAGRGDDLSRVIQGLRPLVEHAEPALRRLVSPQTGLDRFFPALERAAAEVAPVAEQQAGLVTGLSRTLTELARVRTSIQATIAEGPRALQAGTEEFPKQARFMRETTELARRLRPAFASISAAAPGLASAFRTGTPALRRSPALNRRLETTLRNTEAFGTSSNVLAGLRQLATTADVLRPTAAFIAPAQTTCNYITLLTRNLAGALSDGDVVGTGLRTSLVILPQYPESEFGPASKPANGPRAPQARNTPDKESFLHSNPLPNTAAPGQPRECEAGNEKFVGGQQQIGSTLTADGTGTDGQNVNAPLVKENGK